MNARHVARGKQWLCRPHSHHVLVRHAVQAEIGAATFLVEK
jgi:hypothetical protein